MFTVEALSVGRVRVRIDVVYVAVERGLRGCVCLRCRVLTLSDQVISWNGGLQRFAWVMQSPDLHFVAFSELLLFKARFLHSLKHQLFKSCQ
jgi:hypothetical protein